GRLLAAVYSYAAFVLLCLAERRRLPLFCMLGCPPSSTLFPYTTLFRSRVEPVVAHVRVDVAVRLVRPALGHDVDVAAERAPEFRDRKSTRLNSSHGSISYAVFCLKKKKHSS